MADTMQFDLVSPERKLASVAATEVRIPGAEGDFTAMPGHAPFLATLRPGLVVAQSAQGEMRFMVTGGFAEVGAEGVSLLAERSSPAAEVSQAAFDSILSDARAAVTTAADDNRAAAEKTVNDLTALAAELGLTAA